MNHIKSLFAQKQRGILSVYFCAGHPHPDATLDTLRALQAEGVDMVEIGMPFSDPLADGPVIQEAASKALRGGMSVKKLLGQLADVRQDIHIPLILMGYLNPIQHYGFDRFCREASACGIDGLIIPDLPFEVYQREFRSTAERHGLSFIFLVTPETPESRIREIDAATDGFIYAVSSAAVTGAQASFSAARQAYFCRLEQMQLRNPFLIGFGISNAATRQAADAHAAGVIVGSRFVTLLEQSPTPAEAVRTLQKALRE